MDFDFNSLKRDVDRSLEVLKDLYKLAPNLTFQLTSSAAEWMFKQYYDEKLSFITHFPRPELLLNGGPVNSDFSLPKINTEEIDRLITVLTSEIKKDEGANIPNLGKSFKEIIAKTEVWLITDEDIIPGTSIKDTEKKLDFPDLFAKSSPNVFSKEQVEEIKGLEDEIMASVSEKQTQDSNDLNRNLPTLVNDLNEKKMNLRGKEFFYKSCDWLGCYCPTTGTIILRIDRIQKESEAMLPYGNNYPMELLMQKVLLHEFIHAALDLWPRTKEGKIIKKDKDWEEIIKDSAVSVTVFNEESVDNAIVLKIYETVAERAMYEYIYKVIDLQPYFYRNGITMHDTADYNESLEFNLASLIQYKISGGDYRLKPVLDKDDFPAACFKGEYILKHNRIGVFAYGVYAMIIKKNRFSLDKILSTNDIFEGRRQCLKVIDEREFLKHVEEVREKDIKRYYTLPLLTTDGKKVYISSQWKDFDWPFLNQLIEKYLESK